MKISCKVNNHTYETEKLYFENGVILGSILEEKIFPFLTCFTACLGNNLSDGELIKALYHTSKDIFNREDLKEISDLVLNREHLQIDGKILDNLEWEKHWQSVGFIEYQIVVVKFIGENLGNFTRLSALLPTEWTEKLKFLLNEKFSTAFTNLKNRFENL